MRLLMPLNQGKPPHDDFYTKLKQAYHLIFEDEKQSGARIPASLVTDSAASATITATTLVPKQTSSSSNNWPPLPRIWERRKR